MKAGIDGRPCSQSPDTKRHYSYHALLAQQLQLFRKRKHAILSLHLQHSFLINTYKYLIKKEPVNALI